MSNRRTFRSEESNMSAVTDDVLLVRQQTQVSALPRFVYEDKIKEISPNINAQSLPTEAQGSC